MLRLPSFLLRGFAALGLVTGALFAETGSITGQILDPSTAAVANAAITATLESTGLTTIVSSTSTGFYSLAALPPAVYTIAVSAQGFQEMVRKNFIINIAAILLLNFRLSVAGGTTSVKVSDGALAQVETSNFPNFTAPASGTISSSVFGISTSQVGQKDGTAGARQI